jgi:hypothetical protein
MSGYRCRQTTASDGSNHMARLMSPGERSRVTRRQMASDAHVADADHLGTWRTGPSAVTSMSRTRTSAGVRLSAGL